MVEVIVSGTRVGVSAQGQDGVAANFEASRGNTNSLAWTVSLSEPSDEEVRVAYRPVLGLQTQKSCQPIEGQCFLNN